MLKHLLICLLLGCMLQCSDADTLGNEPPVEIVIEGNPSWANGVETLVSLKCGSCHQYPIPDIAPDNIVDDLDLTQYETRVVDGKVIRGADAIGRWIFEGILDNDVTTIATNNPQPRQMPLSYATPLTEGEKDALWQWSELGSPKDEVILDDFFGDRSNGGLLYGDACAYCHFGGDGVKLDNGQWLGPPLRRASVTTAKIKSMWLDKHSDIPLSDQEAEDIRSYILLTLMGKKASN